MVIKRKEFREDQEKQVQVRKEKLRKYIQISKEEGFINNFKPNTSATSLKSEYSEVNKSTLSAMMENKPNVRIAGRIVLKRVMGRASFITIQDNFERIQIYIRKDDLLEKEYDCFSKYWDLGDIIGAEGILFKTKTDELSVRAKRIQLLTKSVRPLPDKFHGLLDKEIRYRQRHIDLITNENTNKIFQIRTKIIRFIRNYFDRSDFIEVETPMMHIIPGGALAKPFCTHHNALNMSLYLRVAPELYLKRLLIGGFNRVYEINRNFRNEGLSRYHNPEFTTIEFYQAYSDYKDFMNLTEDLLRKMAEHVLGTTSICYQNEIYDISKPFLRMTMLESILHFNHEITKNQLMKLSEAKEVARKLGITVEPHHGLGKVLVEIFEGTVEHNLIQPTFITEHPVETSPLARRNDEDPFITDRFELFIGGYEVANGFSELNDAEDQATRFKKSLVLHRSIKESYREEVSSHYDNDYIRALEYGLPPAAGEGIGIDRLVMLFTDSRTIRDVILFPQMRSE